MSNERATTITDTDRLDWLLRGAVQSREQIDQQIRKSRMQIGRAWEKTVAQDDAVVTNVVPFSVISASNRELAIVIGDLRLRRCS
ncbi:MAG TPA: hypothetical protein VM164_08700 [Burkholderiales bacterium]|nr:hypothetical protein [Burkholderiales bacterium]